MKSKFERYIEKILRQTECSKEEKDDMYEEFMLHLELSRDELMKAGMSEKEAELKAIERFGLESEIGYQLQQAIFPYRKELMLALSSLSFVYTISLYLVSIFAEGDAHIGWFIFSMTIHSVLLLIALNQFQWNRRGWMNGLFISHILTYIYGYGIVSSIEHPVQLSLAILNGALIILALYLIYQTTIHDGTFMKETKVLHRMNFVSGLLISGITLFYLWVGMMLFGRIHPIMLVVLIPFVLWILLYFGQLKLIEKNKRIAFSLAVVSILISALLLVFIFSPIL